MAWALPDSSYSFSWHCLTDQWTDTPRSVELTLQWQVTHREKKSATYLIQSVAGNISGSLFKADWKHWQFPFKTHIKYIWWDCCTHDIAEFENLAVMTGGKPNPRLYISVDKQPIESQACTLCTFTYSRLSLSPSEKLVLQKSLTQPLRPHMHEF